MKTKMTLLATTTLVALTLSAPAQAAGSGWYVSVTGGANWVDDTDFSLTGAAPTTVFAWNTDADTGYIVAGAIGFDLGHVWSGLRAEVEATYRENNADGTWASNTFATIQTGTLDYDHESFSVLANVWWDFPLGDATPYIGGGIGWADVNAEGAYTCLAVCTGTVIPFNFSDDGFAWQVGAGLNFQVSPNMKLGVGYRFFQGPEPTAIPPLIGPVLTNEIDNDNHSAVLTLTYDM